MDEFIKLYHTLGFKQNEIVSCLQLNHQILISTRQLRRRLQQLNLFRRKHYSDVVAVAQFIQKQTAIHGQLHGYRWMHLKCLQNNFIVTQDIVRQLLHILDPHGIENRRRKRLRRRQYFSKGPNFLWHIDCYDKLKPFGICISGCIDGFSRYIIWLNDGINTSDPAIIASYYLKTVEFIGGCPHTVRADMGTENGITKQIQEYLRETNDTEHNILPPFLYGTSPHNQRIEMWWSILRKHHSQFWLNLFNTLKDDGLFLGTYLDKGLLQFCFLQLIQDELDTVVLEWNTHQISSSRNSISPKGRPFIMYNMPEMYNVNCYLHQVTSEDIRLCKEICKSPGPLTCEKDLSELILIIMNENEMQMPKSPFDAVDLYIGLRPKLLDIL